MVNFGDIVRGTWPEKFAPRSSTIFSWLMSNYWSTNFFSSQGGRMTFRYSIVSAPAFAPAALSRLGMEQMTPLESDAVAAQPGAPSPAMDSFLNLNGEDVALTTWKRAEDGSGSIVRLVELAGKDSAIDLSSGHLHIDAAQSCSLLEDCADNVPVNDNHVRLTLRPHQIVTLKLTTRPVHP
jgi:alpha-mannosidase